MISTNESAQLYRYRRIFWSRTEIKTRQASNMIRRDFCAIAIIVISFIIHVTDARSKAKTRTRAASPRVAFSRRKRMDVKDFPLSRRLMLIRELSRRRRNIRRISFAKNLRCIARARLCCSRRGSRARFYYLWNVIATYIRTNTPTRWSRSKTITYYLNLITANGALPRLERIVSFNIRVDCRSRKERVERDHQQPRL